MDKEYHYRYGAIGIIINSKGQYLVINDMGFKEDEYDFVGGGREEDETPIENLYREVKEEVGLDSNQLRLIGQSNHKISFDFRGGFREFETPKGIVKYKGQIKDVFVLEFLGDDSDIKI